MLSDAPVGLAYHNEALGWNAQPLPLPNLKLFRVEIAGESTGYVAAPDVDVACTIFHNANPLQEDEEQTFGVY
jgi:hypothetical protein